MKILTLKRYSMTEKGVYGVLLDENKIPICDTLERPWNNNQPLSCIPKGEYTLERFYSNKEGYWTFLVKNVPNRTDILLHKGNLVSNSLGCILLGEGYGYITLDKDQGWGITSSGTAFNEFMSRLDGNAQATLVIEEV